MGGTEQAVATPETCDGCGVVAAPGEKFTLSRIALRKPRLLCADCAPRRQRVEAGLAVLVWLGTTAFSVWMFHRSPDEWTHRALVAFVLFTWALPLTILPHEWGHAFAARAFGVGVKAVHVGSGPPLFEFPFAGIDTQVRLIPSGGVTLFDDSVLRLARWRRAAIVSAGMLVNAGFAAACWLASDWRPWPGLLHDMRPLLPVAAANLWVVLLNLWPRELPTSLGGQPSDGLQLLSLAWPRAASRLMRARELADPARSATDAQHDEDSSIVGRLALAAVLALVALACLLLAGGMAAGAWTGGGGTLWLVALLLTAMAAFVGWSARRVLLPTNRAIFGGRGAGEGRSGAFARRIAEDWRKLPPWPDGTPPEQSPQVLVDAYRRGGMPALADGLRDLLASSPDSVRVRVDLAQVLATIGLDDEALALHASVKDDVPKDGALDVVMSGSVVQLHLLANRADEARAVLERFLGGPGAIADKAHLLDVAACVALTRQRADLLLLSLEWIDRALALEPGRLTLVGTRGSLLVELRREAEAEPELRRAFDAGAADMDMGICCAYLAICAWRRGESRVAARLARRARLLHPEPWLAERLARAESEARGGP